MKHLFTTLILIFSFSLSSQPDDNLNLENQIANMTIDEKIGQLIMIAAASSEHQPTELLLASL